MPLEAGHDQPETLSVVMTGGGSGGHITPLLAVAHQLKQLRPDCRISYIGQRGDHLGDIPAKDPSVDAAYTVRAGKLRRYHGEGWRQLFDVRTMALNLRDGFYVLAGLVQSYRLLKRLRPDVIFVKGGFVGVPVGLAAAWLGIPYVTHDSDAIPGLANRIIARWASRHAVALPKEIYTYPADKTEMVGVPVSHHYRPLSGGEAARQALRQRLGLADYRQVLLMTGGGLGAQRLNRAVAHNASALLKRYPELVIIHLAGRHLAEETSKIYNDTLAPVERQRVVVHGFVANLYDYSAAADVVVTRAGGTSLAEFAAQAKACVVVPNPQLTGGHQIKNAQALAERSAIEIIDEATLSDRPEALGETVAALLDNPARAGVLGRTLSTFAQPDAAKRLAMVLLEVVPKTHK